MTTVNPRHIVFAALLSGATTTPAWALANFARGTLTASITAAATYDSRVQGTVGTEGDYSGSLTPRLNFLREAGRVSLESNAGIRMRRFLDNESFDSDDFFAGLSFRLAEAQGRISSASLNFNYTEDSDLDRFELVRDATKTLGATFNTSVLLDVRNQLSLNAGISSTSSDLRSDQDVYNAGVGYSYSDFLGGTTLGLSYRYTKTESSGTPVNDTTPLPISSGLDSDSHRVSASLTRPIIGDLQGKATLGYRWLDRPDSSRLSGVNERGDGMTYSVGLTGPFLPKSKFPLIESSFDLSYQGSESPGVNDAGRSTIVGTLDASWKARAHTTINAGLSRKQELSSADYTVVVTGGNIGIKQDLAARTAASAQVSYSNEDTLGGEDALGSAAGRDEDVLRGSVSLSHQFVRFWSAHLSYSYESRTSATSDRNYDRHLTTLSATAKF